MNDKTEQTVTDALRLAAKSAAPYSTAMIGASHLNEAADTIDTLRAHLAEAQRDAERLDWIIEHRAYVVSDPDCCDRKVRQASAFRPGKESTKPARAS